MKLFIQTLKKHRIALLILLLSALIFGTVFYFYNLPIEPYGYAAVILGVLFLAMLIIDCFKERRKAKSRQHMIQSILIPHHEMPESDTPAEADYQHAIHLLQNELQALQNQYETARQEEMDVITAWAHQIKTPIAVMRFDLEQIPEESGERLKRELFRIEQYVDMVLQFIRLDSGTNDLVIRTYDLDTLIRDVIHKYAYSFVTHKLRLNYEGTTTVVVTDQKWFACILDQFFSNALKYTPEEGTITIVVSDGMLTIADTGVGIAPEDLPRIFEKGYTGLNGRIDKRASGLGLYLCKKAADLLDIPLSVASTVGEGSVFTMDLREKIRK